MPTAFIAKSDEEANVAALWTEVWEDSGSSAPAALRLYMADIVPLLTSGVLSSSTLVLACGCHDYFMHQ